MIGILYNQFMAHCSKTTCLYDDGDSLFFFISLCTCVERMGLMTFNSLKQLKE